MPTSSKHIFIQVNTEAIIILNAEYNGNIPNEAVLSQTILYEQGSMALGGPIKDMYIDVEAGQEVYITILPLMLYGYNKIYFSDFIRESGSDIVTNLPKFDTHFLSIKIDIDEFVVIGTKERFGLKAVVEQVLPSGTIDEIGITIDPVLRVIQRR
jgi:hypothetical protein